MATVLQAPFYVPRPYDGPVWTGRQDSPRADNTLRVGQPRIFSSSGQGPTRRWAPLYALNDYSLWTGSQLPARSMLVGQPHFYGANGSAYTRDWLSYYSYDETPPWKFSPDPSGVIQILSSQPIYGQGGQVPPFRPFWAYDETSTAWYPIPLTLSAQLLLLFTQQSPFSADWTWPRAYDETPSWYPIPEYLDSELLLYTQAAPFSPDWTWPRAYDETAPWSMPTEYMDSEVLRSAPEAELPLVARPFLFVYDETVPWRFSPDASWLIPTLSAQIVYGQGGQVPPFRAPWTYDETPPWKFSPAFFPPALRTQPPPTTARQYGTTYDETAPWRAAQLVSYSVALATTQFRFYSAPGQVPPFRVPSSYDETAPWRFSPTTPSPVLGTPLSPTTSRQTGTSYDETSPWRAASLQSFSMSLTTTQVRVYGQPGQAPPFRANFTLNDASLWTGGPIRSFSTLQVTPTPIVHGLPSFYAEPSIWIGSQTSAFVATQIRAAPLTQRGPPSFYLETPTWSGAPQSADAIYLLSSQRVYGQGGQVPPFRPNFTLNDPGVWSWPPQRAAIIQLLSAGSLYGQGGQTQARFWRFLEDDASFWTRTTELNAPAMFSILTPPPQPVAGVYQAVVTVTYAAPSRTIVSASTSVSELSQAESASVVSSAASVSSAEESGSISDVS